MRPRPGFESHGNIAFLLNSCVGRINISFLQVMFMLFTRNMIDNTQVGGDSVFM